MFAKKRKESKIILWLEDEFDIMIQKHWFHKMFLGDVCAAVLKEGMKVETCFQLDVDPY